MPAISIQFRRDRKSKPWVVRYAEGPSHRSSSFRTKADAQLYAARLRTDHAAGEWISPDAGRIPLERLGRRVARRLRRACRGSGGPRLEWQRELATAAHWARHHGATWQQIGAMVGTDADTLRG